MINPWAVLGVHRKSTDEEIQKAFHTLAKDYHPDKKRNKGKESKFLFHEVNAAYQALKNKSRRQTFIAKDLWYADRCLACTGTGVKTKSKSLTVKEYAACACCGGAGLNIGKEEHHDSIKL